MLLGLAGVSGVGKSHFADLIAQQLDYTRGKVLTTRPQRNQETSGKVYVDDAELDRLQAAGQLAFVMELLGYRYAYLKADLALTNSVVVEIPYNVVPKLKQLGPQLRTIYIFPHSLEQAQEHLRARHLSPELEAMRLRELTEQLQRMESDSSLRQDFDQIVYNHYNQSSEQEILALARSLLAAA